MNGVDNRIKLLRISPNVICLTLLSFIVIFSINNIFIYSCAIRIDCGPYGDAISQYAYFTDMDSEESMPNWFSVIQLFLVSCALAVTGRVERAAGRSSHRWSTLAGLFLVLSIDEETDLHGMLRKFMPNETLTGTPTGFDWVIPGSLLVLAVVAYFLPWVLKLENRTRLLFIAAGAIYVIGGQGMEAIGALVVDIYYKSFRYILVMTLEETMELTGVLLMLYAVLRRLGALDIWIEAPSRIPAANAGVISEGQSPVMTGAIT